MAKVALTLISLFFMLVLFHGLIEAATFTFSNRCSYTVWPGTLKSANSDPLPETGFELAAGASTSLDAPDNWSGRIWGRTGCSDNSGMFTCATGDCGGGTISCDGRGGAPPATLAEFTLQGSGGQDFYDTSLVDGFNVPLSITPQGGSGGCGSSSCSVDVNAVCPPELQVKDATGNVVACKSACLAFNQDEYCCRGSYANPGTCMPSKYSRLFKSQCPQSYSYAFDDKTSTNTCSGASYVIIFCS